MRHACLSAAILALLIAPLPLVHAADAADGAAVYERACAGCHEGGFGGFFSGAPKTGEADDWTALLEKGNEALIAATLQGIGKMKARGGCDSCTDAEIAAAVEYMVDRSR